MRMAVVAVEVNAVGVLAGVAGVADGVEAGQEKDFGVGRPIIFQQ